jgi:N6-L-threonylcarbamoyladenine synthase
MPLLAVETSCDETSAAVVHQGQVLSNVVSSQVELHAEYGGVVPELATRAHLRNWMPVTRAALTRAHLVASDIDAVAATQGPGLPNALLIGLRAAQGFAFALDRPFVGIHHHEAHLYSPWIGGTPLQAQFDAFERNVSLIVSGGHTLLIDVRAELDHVVLGGTLDDAAGECFDKVGKLLGLGYPGGAAMDKLSDGGNAQRFPFPRPLLREKNDDFSFAGLKTSVRYFLQKNPELVRDAQALKDLCASVQAAIVEVLVTKTIRAARRLGVRCVTASGGVTCNRALRRELATACAQARVKLRLAEPAVCTDNAAMIGVLAERKLMRGRGESSGPVEVLPGWRLDTLGK